jgi:hypothetical protein
MGASSVEFQEAILLPGEGFRKQEPAGESQAGGSKINSNVSGVGQSLP